MAIKRRLITVNDAAEILGLKAKTIHNRKGGTKDLTRIYQGTSVRLIASEVEDHLNNLIKDSQRRGAL